MAIMSLFWQRSCKSMYFVGGKEVTLDFTIGGLSIC
jgi:hypothetical protein